MTTQRERYIDAQTISDEHGKGAEILRQAVASENNLIGAATVITHLLYCEVDMIIRFIRTISVNVPDNSATLTVYRNRAGTLTALTAIIAFDDAGAQVTEISDEIALVVARNALRQNDSVYAIVIRDGTSQDLADWGIFLGWMPDLYDNSSGKTY